MKLHTYLNFGGNCEQAMNFYQENLGGKILFKMTYGQQPDPSKVPAGMENKILYSNMSIGETQLMASDAPPNFQPMRSAYLCLTLDSTEEAERIYKLLSEGGEVFMPIAETFFAIRFAMLRDKFGTLWMLLHQKPM